MVSRNAFAPRMRSQTTSLTMLRITTDENAHTITLRLEGRLEGPWVTLLANCWWSEQARSDGRQLRVDLNDVTFIDTEGKARLAQMHEQGAAFISGDLMTKGIVAEILGE